MMRDGRRWVYTKIASNEHNTSNLTFDRIMCLDIISTARFEF